MLDHPVCLRVVCGGGVVADVEETHTASHRVEVNWAHLLEVRVSGTLCQAIQCMNSAWAQYAAAVARMGTASIHLEVLSMIVNKY